MTLFHYRAEKAERAAQVVRAAAPAATVTLAESLEAAAEAAEIVGLTPLWDAPQRAVISSIGDRMVGRILLDVSNPLDVTPTGIHFRTPFEGSAGQFVAALLPPGVGHVKAFSNLATSVLSTAADQSPRAVLPYLTDSEDAARRVQALLDHSGWLPRHVGDISQSADLEIGGRYNKVSGRLGRTVLDEEEFTQQFDPQKLVVD